MDWLSQISRQKYIQDLNYGYARVQAIGINFGHEWTTHNFNKNASILINKVTFFSWDLNGLHGREK